MMNIETISNLSNSPGFQALIPDRKYETNRASADHTEIRVDMKLVKSLLYVRRKMPTRTNMDLIPCPFSTFFRCCVSEVIN